MTVKELKDAIAELPDDMLVEVTDQEQGPSYSRSITEVDSTHWGVCILISN